ncbi:MAG: proline--tRNA ligase [Candidatus Yanofskybacteria bacterium RIFCSPLOWO2_12_FULL_44_13b]|uniref:Proline--tRNA ligase n=2 Tax=Candidatus Yanofskyibacteriota TaxID=1752733 RepID=A0A1F8H151_9BACT|nr:MAG: Proline-tRNA ligase [Candidatus Yanofskybacteria bacterium GW2011_GWA2_44_10]KKT89964.1 MAG: Proline-tRNA ligase [Candidatus Yanofskybacteria bacterium GW2011_GWB1_45_11]OGN02075.1 MAG: proline--tRNA ligase [Candidatus Yanofskybacteria bacterium RIFCSPHIGHO2_01_FULL_44_110b]OGN18516.1 MAG: proline--tRNA ligase [Candidatus Yanofskybacteria bacterium RIFCSPHIGHO2_12_FULL_44_29b]OGN26468.1 MAG: proline--tRNA ligase [Candidatus Yanofskybacteria bacterium RIFCSPLOWO2_01_FULL_44_88]OGN31413.
MKTDKTENKKITPRSEDFSQWYLDVIQAAGLAEHAPVKGCMIIKPNGYAIWENIQANLDAEFKKKGVRNAYFPLLIPEKFLRKEAQHVKGFAPEVAVVTHAGGKKLEEPYVIRPTSETIINDSFAKWIQSHRDLPLLINQWCNVVRWELRPRLFLRTTEFLWQEGHTAHATEAEADDFANQMLEVYKNFVQDILAIPVYAGLKTESEKFAGADKTYTIEAMTQDGKALQMATSHNLGQNFAKAFDIQYMDENNSPQYVWQTSWGLSTRTIGGMIMVHSDDTGLILPPRIAPLKVIIIPIWKNDAEKDSVIGQAGKLAEGIKEANISVKVDETDGRPGEKYFNWERQGVPLRIELGPKEISDSSAVLVRRDTGAKETVKTDSLIKALAAALDSIQSNLLERARLYFDSNTIDADNMADLKKAIGSGNFARMKRDLLDEKEIKEISATVRCVLADGNVIVAKAY